jgi:hypothetical protein
MLAISRCAIQITRLRLQNKVTKGAWSELQSLERILGMLHNIYTEYQEITHLHLVRAFVTLVS